MFFLWSILIFHFTNTNALDEDHVLQHSNMRFSAAEAINLHNLWLAINTPGSMEQSTMRRNLRKSVNKKYIMSDILSLEFNLMAIQAKDKLESAIASYPTLTDESLSEWLKTPFDDIIVSIPLTPKFMKKVGIEDGSKFFIGANTVQTMKRKIVVYGAGIDNRPVFELAMGKLGADVYGFDCTNEANPAWTSFKFYSWCIGVPEKISGLEYTKNQKKKYSFFTLHEIMTKLGHKKIDILKIDIEGFEWRLFENEIINNKNSKIINGSRYDHLPSQLLFELHTHGAKEMYVPPRLTNGKTRHEVNKLMLALHNLGYYTVHLEINSGDTKCAELVMLRMK
eukprot:gene7764-15887_t